MQLDPPAFMQDHMQLDPPGSLFRSKLKHILSQHGRRLKTRAPENTIQTPFAHPKVPPKERFGPCWHQRRLKNRATEIALQTPFAHPKVPPKEGFGYN
uniref:Uncharacterized protein n=1 Tax=Anas platyrhynchos TaxID=8839 RepID=A0A8B9QZD8_ANAPL